ncbi:MAG: phage integrase N-terminal SAM-like domain-containing protein [Pirellulaceae bacterium]|nr:phage integrase N-terminal SAM-like domain-containing protein [Pirellulaceae bacterium]
MRQRHLSIRTERAYLRWIEQFLRFHRDQAGAWRHPDEMGSLELNQFLTHLAVRRNVAARISTPSRNCSATPMSALR